MARKRFRTPPTLPEDNQCRGTVVPASKEWLGLYSDALLELTYSYNYEQVEPTDLDPETVANLCYLQYLDWLDSTCSGGPSEPCLAPELPGIDTPVFRTNPTTGEWEQWNNGEWEEPSGDYAIPTTPSRPEATDPLKECGAASNAANTLHDLFDTIWTFYQTEIDPFLDKAELAAAVGVAIGSMFGPISASFLEWSGFLWETFRAGVQDLSLADWKADFNAILVCILSKNATVTAGVVHFDFYGVSSDLVGFLLPVIDDHTVIRWEVWYLIQAIGSQGLDTAGGLQNVTGDCDTCDTWCVELNPRDLGFSLTRGYFNSSGQAVGTTSGGVTRATITRIVDTTNCRITRLAITTLTAQSHACNTSLVASPSNGPINQYNTFTGSAFPITQITPDNAAWYSNSASTTVTFQLDNWWQGQAIIQKVRVMGTGINPFAIGSNC